MTQPTIEEHAAGGVLVRRGREGYEVCLIRRDRHGGNAWGLPKGHLEGAEDAASAARREVLEETGTLAEILEPLAPIRYQFAAPGSGRVSKTVAFFLMRAVSADHPPRDDAEVREVQWMPPMIALTTLSYENERRVVEQALQRLARPEVAARIPDAS